MSLPLIATPHLSSRTPPRWGVASLDQLCRVREPSIGFTILNLSGRRLVRKLRDDIELLKLALQKQERVKADLEERAESSDHVLQTLQAQLEQLQMSDTALRDV